jgi:hypothetical protein
MKHETEFPDESKEARKKALDALAADYVACFSTPSGKTVLDDLRKKFGLDRRRFDPRVSNPSATAAALIEGECNVLRDIEAALKHVGANL